MKLRTHCRSLLGAGIMLASGAVADAAVTFVDVVPDIRTNILNVEFNVDIDGNGFRDVWFIQGVIGLKAFTITSVRVQSVRSEGNTYDAVPLEVGEVIGSQPTAPIAWAYSGGLYGYDLASYLIVGSTLVEYGLFPGQDAYLGLELTMPDGVHYGYLHLEVPEFSTLGIIKSYAFETTPGVPIIAGSEPEPGRIATLMLGFILTAAIRRRNRH